MFIIITNILYPLQKVSAINKQNRAKYQDVHCMGTKSLPQLIDEKVFFLILYFSLGEWYLKTINI